MDQVKSEQGGGKGVKKMGGGSIWKAGTVIEKGNSLSLFIYERKASTPKVGESQGGKGKKG